MAHYTPPIRVEKKVFVFAFSQNHTLKKTKMTKTFVEIVSPPKVFAKILSPESFLGNMCKAGANV
jgi:hypothetical protein